MPQETVPLRGEDGESLPLAVEYVAWRVASGTARLWLAGDTEAILDPADDEGEVALPWWLALSPDEREEERQKHSLFPIALGRVQQTHVALAELEAISDAVAGVTSSTAD